MLLRVWPDVKVRFLTGTCFSGIDPCCSLCNLSWLATEHVIVLPTAIDMLFFPTIHGTSWRAWQIRAIWFEALGSCRPWSPLPPFTWISWYRLVVCVNKMDTDAVKFSRERFLAACQVVFWRHYIGRLQRDCWIPDPGSVANLLVQGLLESTRKMTPGRWVYYLGVQLCKSYWFQQAHLIHLKLLFHLVQSPHCCFGSMR